MVSIQFSWATTNPERLAKSLGLSRCYGLVMLEMSLAVLRPQVIGDMEDAVLDMGELMAASILVQVWVEHAYVVHRLPDSSKFTKPYHHEKPRDLAKRSGLVKSVIKI